MNKKKQKIAALVIGAILLFIVFVIFILWLFLSKSEDLLLDSNSEHYQELLESVPQEISQTELKLFYEKTSQLLDGEGSVLMSDNIITLESMITLKKQLAASRKAMITEKNRTAYLGLLQIEQFISNKKEERLAKQEARELGDELELAILPLTGLRGQNPPLSQAFKAKDQGDLEMNQGSYFQARDQYEAGLEFVKKAEEWRENLLQSQLKAIEAKINDLKLDEANALLVEAMNRFPGNEQLQGLSRDIKAMLPILDSLKQVNEWVQQEDYLQARSLLQNLTHTYPENEFLAKKLETIQKTIIAEVVQPITNKAKELFDQGEYNQALDQLKKAAAILPEDPSIRDAIKNIQKSIEETQIEEKLKQAYSLYKDYRWKAAKTKYITPR